MHLNKVSKERESAVMQDLFARVFIVALLILYAGVALVFIIGILRTWIWRPIKRKISVQQPERNHRALKSASHERIPS